MRSLYRAIRIVETATLMVWAFAFAAMMFVGMMFVMKWLDKHLPTISGSDPWDWFPSVRALGHTALDLAIVTAVMLVVGLSLSYLSERLRPSRTRQAQA
jgi:hypothetical protein